MHIRPSHLCFLINIMDKPYGHTVKSLDVLCRPVIIHESIRRFGNGPIRCIYRCSRRKLDFQLSVLTFTDRCWRFRKARGVYSCINPLVQHLALSAGYIVSLSTSSSISHWSTQNCHRILNNPQLFRYRWLKLLCFFEQFIEKLPFSSKL